MRFETLSFLFFLASLSVITTAKAQEVELGLIGGISVYSGDLSSKEFGFYFEDANPAGGLYLRYRPTNRLALRVHGVFTKVSAVADVSGVGDEGGEPLNFQSKINEMGIQAELDLFYLGDQNANHLAPYIYAGYSFISFDPEGERDGVFTRLQPLATEGQGIGGPNYAPVPYSLSEGVLNVGGGLRWRASDRIVVGVELGGRRVASDYLDDVSNTNVNYFDILENSGPIGADFSNPSIQNPGLEDDVNYVRGGEFADWFFIGGVTVGIIIGEGRGGGRGQTGCYKF